MRERGRSRPIGTSNGSALILMLFSVLCLTVLAALSLISANSQWNLATRRADSVTAYYAADLLSCEIFEDIKAGGTGIAEVVTDAGAIYYSYIVEIDDARNLEVLIRYENGEYQVLTWKTIQTGAWVAEEGLPVWDGKNGE